jgi:hypothetical protein
MRRWGLVVAGIAAACWLLPGSVAALPPSSPEIAMTLFVTPDGSGGCSAVAPCSLREALVHVPSGGVIYVGQGTYTSTGGAVAVITKSLTLLGGWERRTVDPIVRDPVAFPSILDGQGARRGASISGDITTTLDGFTITGGNAAGLGDCGHPLITACGGGILVSQAHAILSNNIITGNTAAITRTEDFAGFAIGGGIALIDTVGTVITGSVIVSNAASLKEFGRGGGVAVYCLAGGVGTQVVNNQIISNVGAVSEGNDYGAGGYGGGGYARNCDDTLFQGNIVAGNSAARIIPYSGAGGLEQFDGSGVYLDNLVQGNRGRYAMRVSLGSARLERNRLLDNETTLGLQMIGVAEGAPSLVNNIVANSGSAFAASGSYPSTVMTVTLLHNTLAGSGSGTGVYAICATVYLTNTIIAGFAQGITESQAYSSSVIPDHTLFWETTVTGTMGSDWVSGDPLFVNAPAGDYHIGPGSAAINQGVWTSVLADIDGEPRLGFPDIGADEYWAPGSLRRIFLPLVLRGG